MSTTQSPPSGPEFWQSQIHAWQQSGLSGAQFCKRQQLTYHQFVYWRQKLVSSSQSTARPVASAPKGFAEARLKAAAADTEGLSLTLPTGLKLEGITAANLAVVMQLLEAL